MQLHNTTGTDIELASKHVIKAGGFIEASDGVMNYPDNRIALGMALASGALALQKPEPKATVKPKDER
jgi:hypothetical protein